MPVITHQIRHGETLSGIAKEYGFGSNWQPIMNLNGHKKLLNTNDERRIPAGASILIPRTAKEYDEAIASLNDLLRQVDKDTTQSLKELDTYKAEADRVGAAVDIAADVAFALKGAVKASVKYGPRYAKYVIRKETLEAAVSVTDKLLGLSESDEGRIVKSAGDAVVEQTVMTQAKRAFDAQKARKDFNKGLVGSMAKKAAVTSAKVVAPIEMTNGVGDLVDVVCDVALAAGKGVIAAAEAVAPSKVAKHIVWVQSGEHPDDTNARMKRFVQTTKQKSATRLRTTITKLQDEKKLVYGTSQGS